MSTKPIDTDSKCVCGEPILAEIEIVLIDVPEILKGIPNSSAKEFPRIVVSFHCSSCPAEYEHLPNRPKARQEIIEKLNKNHLETAAQ